MELKRFFHTESGKVIISLLLGLGLATLFKRSCQGKNCIEFKAPSLEDIKNKKYKPCILSLSSKKVDSCFLGNSGPT